VACFYIHVILDCSPPCGSLLLQEPRHQVLRVHPELLQYVRMLLEVHLIWQLPRRPIRMLGPHLFLDQVGQSITTALSE
jgi:hypothetical protein